MHICQCVAVKPSRGAIVAILRGKVGSKRPHYDIGNENEFAFGATGKGIHKLSSVPRLDVGRSKSQPRDVAVRRLIVEFLPVVIGDRAVEGQWKPALKLRVAGARRWKRVARPRRFARRNNLERSGKTLAVVLPRATTPSVSQMQPRPEDKHVESQVEYICIATVQSRAHVTSKNSQVPALRGGVRPREIHGRRRVARSFVADDGSLAARREQIRMMPRGRPTIAYMCKCTR